MILDAIYNKNQGLVSIFRLTDDPVCLTLDEKGMIVLKKMVSALALPRFDRGGLGTISPFQIVKVEGQGSEPFWLRLLEKRRDVVF